VFLEFYAQQFILVHEAEILPGLSYVIDQYANERIECVLIRVLVEENQEGYAPVPAVEHETVM
jgi:hypothetical protein